MQLKGKERGEQDVALPDILFTGKEEDGRIPWDLSLWVSIGLHIISSSWAASAQTKGREQPPSTTTYRQAVF